MWFIIAGISVVLLAIIYQFVIHPLLLSEGKHPAEVVPKVDSVAWTLWKSSRTILASRLLLVIPLVLGVHDWLAATYPNFDLTPYLTKIMSDVPEQYRAVAVSLTISALGILFEYLRRVTTVPLEAKQGDGV